MPLVDQGGPDDKKGKRQGLEARLTDKMFAFTSTQSNATAKLRLEVDELKKTFDEKIRRQALVQQ